MYISKHELISVEVYLRSILQAVMADDYEYLANIVGLIDEDLNLHRAGKALLYSVIDYFVRYKDHEE